LTDANRSGLDRSFFARETTEVAVDLIGTILVSVGREGTTSGRIVEVEAYGDAADQASHAARLKQGGVRVMSGLAGIAYVYRSYGIHDMFNIVAKAAAATGAVLIRAIEPIEGIELMRRRRGVDSVIALCSGPGKLCSAFGITLEMHGMDVTTSSALWLVPGRPARVVFSGERIGISRSRELPWRFFDAESAYISAHRRGSDLAATR
jgi:DNA-3-methyladenine glycosylase